MMQYEFEELRKSHGCAGPVLSPEDYTLVDFVYTWHPAVRSKVDIVDLFRIGGCNLIQELRPRALACMERELKLDELRREIKRLQDKLHELEVENV